MLTIRKQTVRTNTRTLVKRNPVNFECRLVRNLSQFHVKVYIQASVKFRKFFEPFFLLVDAFFSDDSKSEVRFLAVAT